MEQLLQQLADRLGVAVEVIWQILIIQARIVAYQNTFNVLLAIVVICVSVYFIKYVNKEWYEEGKFFGIALSIAGIIIGFSWGISSLYWAVTGFINPRYFAIREILHSLGPSN